MIRAGKHRPMASWCRPRCLFTMIVGWTLLWTVPAVGQSGGVYLAENGGPINGTSSAGSAAVARDAETAWLNPAGMTRLESVEIMASVMPFFLDMQFDPGPGTTIAGGDGGQQGGWIPGAGFFLAAPINEHVAIGFSIAAPAGLATDPNDDWVGRNWITETQLVVLDFQPSLGVRLSDQWSVGVGIDIQYANFKQKLAGPVLGRPLQIDGDSWEAGFSASALWEPAETTRFGVRYRSQISHDLDGDFTLRTAVPRPVSTSFDLPMSVTLSAYHDLNDRLALMLDVGWTNWGAFERNIITFDSSGNAAELPRNFRDTWSVALGAHIRPAENWLVMLGGGYTSSAVSDADRTPDLPTDEQVRLSVGLEYRINERWTVGGSYMFLWLGDNDIDQTRPVAGRMVGDYDAFAHVIGLYGALRF